MLQHGAPGVSHRATTIFGALQNRVLLTPHGAAKDEYLCKVIDIAVTGAIAVSKRNARKSSRASSRRTHR
jgi:hypothetical protein